MPTAKKARGPLMITREHLAQILARSGYALEAEGVALRAREHPVLQKQEANNPKPKRKASATRDGGANGETDGGNHPRFALIVHFRVYDRRQRDLDGMR